MPAPFDSQDPLPLARQRTSTALRLHLLLRKLKTSDGQVLYRVLPKVLGVVATPEEIELGWPFAESTALIGKMLVDFGVEIDGTKMTVDEKTYHLQCRPAVTAALAPVRLSVPWQQVRDGIGEALISNLLSADVALRRYVTEQMLVQGDLQDLRASIQAALESLSASALPEELKAFISLHLVRIRTALDEYEFRGLPGLQDALAGYLGSIGASHELITQHATDPEKHKLADVLAVANSTVTLAHGMAWAWPMLHTGFNIVVGLLGS